MSVDTVSRYCEFTPEVDIVSWFCGLISDVDIVKSQCYISERTQCVNNRIRVYERSRHWSLRITRNLDRSRSLHCCPWKDYILPRSQTVEKPVYYQWVSAKSYIVILLPSSLLGIRQLCTKIGSSGQLVWINSCLRASKNLACVEPA